MLLSIISLPAITAENLTLSCDGLIRTVSPLPDAKTDHGSIKKQESYIFKNGRLLKGRADIQCAWSEEEIRCESSYETPKRVYWIVNVNRVTGHVDALTSYVDGKGDNKLREEFSGACKVVKRKF